MAIVTVVGSVGILTGCGRNPDGKEGISGEESVIGALTGEDTAEENIIIEEEPEILKNYDKNKIVNTYFNSILDRITTDSLISYDMLKSWELYEIVECNYIKEIADNYYQYDVNIKINNTEASLPRGVTEVLNNNEYNVISLNIYILKDTQSNSFQIRKVEV